MIQQNFHEEKVFYWAVRSLPFLSHRAVRHGDKRCTGWSECKNSDALTVQCSLEPESEPKLWTTVEPESEPKINNFGSATLHDCRVGADLLFAKVEAGILFWRGGTSKPYGCS